MGTKMLRDPSLKSLSLPTTFQTLWFRIWPKLCPKLVNEGTISSECGVGRLPLTLLRSPLSPNHLPFQEDADVANTLKPVVLDPGPSPHHLSYQIVFEAVTDEMDHLYLSGYKIPPQITHCI